MTVVLLSCILTAILFLTIASAFFSASETAIFSLKPPVLRQWRSSGTPRQKQVVRLADESQETLISILIANNLVNIVLAVLVNRLGEGIGLGSSAPLIAGVTATILLLVFSEITPKTIAYGRAAALSQRVSPLILAIRWLLHPAVVLMRNGSHLLLAMLGSAPAQSPLSAEEFQTFIGVGERLSAFNAREAALLRDVFALREKTAAGALIPRVDICAVDASWDAETVIAAIRRHRHRRLAVINGGFDNIAGLLDVRRFMRLSPEDRRNWRHTCIEEPAFIPEHTSMEKTMTTLRAGGTGMAFIVDEYGGIAGLVTLEDLLEEVVGDLSDEYDEPQWQSTRIGDRHWRLVGLVPLQDLSLFTGFTVPEDTVADTVSGLIAETLGNLPEPGDRVHVGDFEFEVRRVARRRCMEVDIRHLTEPELLPSAADGESLP